MAQWLTKPTRNHEVAGSIGRCHELWCGSQTRLGSHVAELWRRLVATAPIRLLAWEPPYAEGAAQEKAKRQKKKKKRKEKKRNTFKNILVGVSFGISIITYLRLIPIEVHGGLVG